MDWSNTSFSEDLANATTSHPLATSEATVGLPSVPVAPVTNIFIGVAWSSIQDLLYLAEVSVYVYQFETMMMCARKDR